MQASEAIALSLAVPDAGTVSALWMAPARPRACVVFAHGAGAGMAHPFMASVAATLGERGIATLRFNFPAMERGSKRPDSPAVAQAAVRAAVAEARRRLPEVPHFAAGKSFGGRMSSQAQAREPLEGIRGLVFVGFPLHPAGRPGIERAAHLADVRCPMLFLQGTRDELADLALLRGVLSALGERARVYVIDDADHSFHVRARSGTTDAQVIAAMADTMADWFAEVAGPLAR